MVVMMIMRMVVMQLTVMMHDVLMVMMTVMMMTVFPNSLATSEIADAMCVIAHSTHCSLLSSSRSYVFAVCVAHTCTL